MPRVGLAVFVLLAGFCGASSVRAAGGGGSAGGAGAQNQPASGLPLGEAGPLGSPNNPRRATETGRSGDRPVVDQQKATPEPKAK